MEIRTELVHRAQQGDAEAFSKLYEEIYKDLYRFALYILKNTHDAEDAVSDTVMDAYRTIRILRNPDSFKAWIFQILSNKCRQRLNSYRIKMMEIPEDLVSDCRDMSEHMDVRRAFARLSDEERLILSLNIFAGYTSREIAESLVLNESTVRSKQSRALKKMKKALSV